MHKREIEEKDGVMEYWNIGLTKNILNSFHIIPSLHYSSIPEFSCGGIK